MAAMTEQKTTTEHVVVADAYLASDDKGNHLRYWRGDKVSLTDEEAERALALGAVVKPEDADTVLASDWVQPEPTDEELSNMSAAEAAAFVGQHPNLAGRLYEVERRGKNRKTVIAATGHEDEPTNTARSDSGDTSAQE